MVRTTQLKLKLFHFPHYYKNTLYRHNLVQLPDYLSFIYYLLFTNPLRDMNAICSTSVSSVSVFIHYNCCSYAKSI